MWHRALLLFAIPWIGLALPGCDPAEPLPDTTASESTVPPGGLQARTSEEGLFVIDLWPRNGGPPLHRLHAWVVRIRDPAGRPVTPDRVTLTGGMPQHGHGLVTQPRATDVGPDGEVVIEGMKFHMPGIWTLRIEIVAGSQADTAIVEIEVAP